MAAWVSWASDGEVGDQVEEVDIFRSEALTNDIEEVHQENFGVGQQFQNRHKTVMTTLLIIKKDDLFQTAEGIPVAKADPEVMKS